MTLVLSKSLAVLPALTAAAALAAVATWGQLTKWQAPRFSALFTASGGAVREDWCATHNVPESRCIACHPELAGESPADWCKEHGVPESRCVTCHPEIAITGVASDWCKEHGLPETCCTLCHPEIARKGELAADPDAVTVESGQEPASRPARVGSGPTPRDPSKCQTHLARVQFASAAAMRKTGIELGKVVERNFSDRVQATAEVDYVRPRYAKVTSVVPGTVWRVDQRLGDAVRAGTVLALVAAPELGRAKSDLLHAAAELESTVAALARAQRSSEAGFRTAADRAESEAKAQAARIRLFTARQALAGLGIPPPGDGDVGLASIATLGLPAATAAALPAGAPAANLLALTAPIDGVVVKLTLVAGTVVDQKDVLFEIADTSSMQLEIAVPLAESRRIALGQNVVFRPAVARDEAATGKLTWISTAIDPTSQTLKVRAELDNQAGTLRAHLYGTASIQIRAAPKAIAVPTKALQWEGCCHIVFVRLADEIFQTRKVKLGTADAAYTEVLAGLLPDEVVVTEGSSVLKAEILKSRLGAGCCVEK